MAQKSFAGVEARTEWNHQKKKKKMNHKDNRENQSYANDVKS